MALNVKKKTMKKVCLLIYFLVCLNCCLRVSCFVAHEEPHALLALKSTLRDNEGGHGFSDWKYKEDNVTLCSWSRVTCEEWRVVTLDLSNMNLTGTIPDEIQLLRHLVTLNISNNSFQGPLPEVIFRLTQLKFLDISRNNFNGSFPRGVAALKKLVNFTAYSNSFTGMLPSELKELQHLHILHLGGSYFTGRIPPEYGELASLRYLNLAGNSLFGSIPPQLGKLHNLQHLEIGYNGFTGEIPWQLGNLSMLKYLDISTASLSGSMPAELSKLHKLSALFLFKNMLTGHIPKEYGNLISLESLDLSFNNLTGPIPGEFSKLHRLTRLSVMCNSLNDSIPKRIAELRKLRVFEIWNNSFSGSLPLNLGSNTTLEWVDASSNQLSGPIPPHICSGNKLFKLLLFSNRFTGEIPQSLANCSTLWRLRIASNNLSGHIPIGFGGLQNFTFMDVSHNNLSGIFPSDLHHAPRLEYINVEYNSFQGGLPSGIWASPRLQELSAGYSNLSGKLPLFRGCKNIYRVELQGNRFIGTIPTDIGDCQKLVIVKLNQNKLSGEIPYEMANLPSISDIDLSGNFLTGMIPMRFENCRTLEFFNVSHNKLSGPIPLDGIFKNISSSVFGENQGLCGGVLTRSPCSTFSPTSGHTNTKKQTYVVWVVGAMFLVILFFTIVGTRWLYKRYKWFICGEEYARQEHEEGPWRMTAFQRLNFTAKDVLECLKSTNIVGMGAAGTVYRADLPGGEVIAVKKLWRIEKDGNKLKRKVLSEVDVLGNVRHRNIVRLLGCCSNNEDTLLLYEYMPNGSLADLLHGKKQTNLLADWITRYNIAVGVAEGLCYLHQDCNPVIVHRDVKPNNILLDANMNARVADFGVAKLIQSGSESMSIIAGSYGYIAPEYAYSLQVHEKSDVYSFGVVLLELLTGRRPMDQEFGDALNIADWVREKLQTKEGAAQVLDQSVGASCSTVQEEMMLVLRVALLCTSSSPADRPSMRDVVTMLSEAKPRRKNLLDLEYRHSLKSHTASQENHS